MNSEQIILALAVARERSISKAAESLFISQPAASSMLKKLETEIGYSIFRRERDGVNPTDEGRIFLEQALNIQQAQNVITQAGQGIRTVDFTVFSLNLDFSALAFETLCERYGFDSYTGQMRFQLCRDIDDASRMIVGGASDIAVIMCLKSLLESFIRKMKQDSLESVLLCEIPMALTCKKGHPIIKDGSVHYDLLREYPGFSGVPRSTLEPYWSFYDEKLVGQTRMTYVMDPGPMRYRLLHKTNGFMFSLPVSDEIRETYDLESVILKENMKLTAFAVFYSDSPKKQLIDEYLQLCRDFASQTGMPV